MPGSKKLWMVFLPSMLIAFFGWTAPSGQTPLNYAAMLRMSIPCAAAWALVLAFSLVRFKRRGLWLLLGAPMAMYWPVWLMFNHLPLCYYNHNCM
jgi:hypothetical protein